MKLTVTFNAPTLNAATGMPVAREVVGGALPPGGEIGDLLTRSNNVYGADWVTPATRAESDNTRPITSAAVYTEIGNINALLSTI